MLFCCSVSAFTHFRHAQRVYTDGSDPTQLSRALSQLHEPYLLGDCVSPLSEEGFPIARPQVLKLHEKVIARRGQLRRRVDFGHLCGPAAVRQSTRRVEESGTRGHEGA
jgi:hypothetical protein